MTFTLRLARPLGGPLETSTGSDKGCTLEVRPCGPGLRGLSEEQGRSEFRVQGVDFMGEGGRRGRSEDDGPGVFENKYSSGR